VARALEAQYAGRLTEHAAELAEHFAHSSDRADLAQAVRYSERAAERALAVSAYGEAARLFAQALEVQEVLNPDDAPKRFALLIALGEALSPAGEAPRAAEEVAPEALRLAEAMGNDAGAAQACELAIDALHRQRGPVVVMSDPYFAWAQRLDRCAAPGTRARAYADCIMGSVLRVRGQREEADRRVRRALDLARTLDEPEVLFRSAASALFPGALRGAVAEQKRLAREIAALPRHGVRYSTLALVLQRAQTFFLADGDRAAAEQVWKELDALAEHARDVVLLLWPHEIAALRATLDGRLEEAISLAARVAQRGEEIGSARAGRNEAASLTWAPLLYLGRYSTGTGPIIEGLDEAGQRLVELVGQAWADPKRPDARDALKLIIASIRTDLRGVGGGAWWFLDLALEAAVEAGDMESANVLENVIQSQFGEVVALPGAMLSIYNHARAVGAAAMLRGDQDAAHKAFNRSLDWATRLGYRPEIALSRLALAELLLAGPGEDHARAQAHLDFAIEEFRVMKMQPALERALRHKGLLHA
jgi:hypothetical protein